MNPNQQHRHRLNPSGRSRLKAVFATIVAGVTLTACTAVTAATSDLPTTTDTTASATALLADNVESHAEADDTDYDAAEAVTITLVDGASKASPSEGVEIDGDTVAISAPGTYVLTGTLSDGRIVVNSEAEGKVRIVLDNASITNTDGSALVITEADEAVLVLAEGSSNSLTDGDDYDTSAEDAPNAALFSMADLTIGGAGSLTVTGNTNDGIASKDGLVFLGGTIEVTATDDGIRGKDYLVISGGTVTVTAEGDGLKSDNEDDDTVGYILVQDGTVTVSAGDDGAHAEGDLAIEGGKLTIAKSTEGLEGANVIISGGEVDVTASDDGLNATSGTAETEQQKMQDDGSLLALLGGTLRVDADGDGLDSNGDLVITGGTTVVSGPTNSGNGALDANGGITVTGGTLVAAGSAGMAETPGADSTNWLAVTFAEALAAGETGSIVQDGAVGAVYTTVEQVSSLGVADPGISGGESYDVYVGGTLSGTVVGTYSDSADLTGAAKVDTVTAGEGATGGMGGDPGGGPGGGGRPR